MPKGKLKYSEPIITRIKLDPEQAVLAACKDCSNTMGIQCRFTKGTSKANCHDAIGREMAAFQCYLGAGKGQTTFINYDAFGVTHEDVPS